MMALAAMMTGATTRSQARVDDLDPAQDLDRRLGPGGGQDQDQGQDQDPQKEGAAATETTMIVATVATDKEIAASASKDQ